MSLPSQVDKTGKHRAAAMKESVQSGEVYYGMGPPALDPSHTEVSAGTSGVYNPEKAPQSLGHYQQQAAPVKWMHQDAMQGTGWSQEAPLAGWGQNFPSYMGGVNVRGPMFHKGGHEGLAMGAESQMQEVFRDNSQAQWDPMHQLQGYPQQQQQSHAAPHTLQAPMLQPFQTFRQSKQQQQQQQFNPGYYTGFPQNKAMQNLGYSEQPKQQQPLLHQIQQQQQQQQQQLQHHHQLQQQQQLQLQQHLQQQQQQHLQQQKQIQLQQYHQQQLQERQCMQPVQQMGQQNVQQEVVAVQVATKQNFVSYQSPEPSQQEVKKEDNLELPKQELCTIVKEMVSEKVVANPVEILPNAAASAQPRRSRRLSREGQSPTTEGLSQNGVVAAPAGAAAGAVPAAGQKAGEGGQTGTGGVIQSTRRRRRASKEINLETLAQQASKRESLPAKVKEDGPPGRQSSSMAPLVMPVSVPVPRVHQDNEAGLSQGRPGAGERSGGQTAHKPSVIVARRRSLRNSVTESFVQDGENDSGTDDDGKPKPRRRPRPEPLIIPPPRPSTFIPPSVYSSITQYQSNLRSPVRQLDNPLVVPPYTPPPILSPVRGGSGLYFSTFLSNMAATGAQILPPAIMPKQVSVSLLRLASTESTPPLTIVTDATPVSLEPRINIGQQYQAAIPDLQSPTSSQWDQDKADLVWLPIENLKHGGQETVADLMNMACSSVFSGGGTNQELVLHCLYESGGDLMETLGRLMLQDVVFPKGHPLSDYHYSGSDSWTPEEKRYFNKGISAYRKDFFMVQKLVQTKTVAQCVEFYYTYKKQVKVGRNGILTFGPPGTPVDKHSEAVVDIKSSQVSRPTHGETGEDHKKAVSSEQNQESSHQARVAQSLQAHDYAATVLVCKESDNVRTNSPQPSAHPRHRAEHPAKKAKAPPKAPPKPPPDPDAVFPCKKCDRVFYKVKSRSAHMKSHAEQEKKAAALKQRQQEEEEQRAEARARTAALQAAAAAAATSSGSHRPGTADQDQEEGSGSGQESTEAEDDDDEDWH